MNKKDLEIKQSIGNLELLLENLNPYGEIEDTEGIVGYGKTGELSDLIQGLDLSKQEDVAKLFRISRVYERCSCKQILKEDGSRLFPNGYIEQHLYYPLNLSGKLEKLDAMTLEDKRLLNGHQFVKISSESLWYWARPFEQVDVSEIFSSASSKNANALLTILIISIEIASQAFNRYVTGYLLYAVDKQANNSGRSTEDIIKNHPDGHIMLELIKVQKEMLLAWNEVFLKYLSNIIQNPDYAFQAKSEKLTQADVLDAIAFINARKWEYNKPLIEKIIESVADNTHCVEIEVEVAEIIEKIKKFQSVLAECNGKMSYVEKK